MHLHIWKMRNINWLNMFLFFFFFWSASFQLVPVTALHGNPGRLHLHVAGHTNLRTLFGDYPFVKNYFKHLLQIDGRDLSHKDISRILTTNIFRPETTIDSLTTTSTDVTNTTISSPSTTFSQTTTTRAYYCNSPESPSDGACPTKNDITLVDATSLCGCTQELKLNDSFPKESFQVYLENKINGQRLKQSYEVVDNYTITATLNASKPGDYNLMCVSNSSGNFENLCWRKVIIGYAPLDVETLVCVSWNWNVLRCNWTLPYNPAQLPSEDYLVYLKTSTNEFPCDQKPAGCLEQCCEWSVPNYQPADEYFSLTFSVQNQLGSANFDHTFNNREIIIPDAAKEIILNTTNGSLSVDVQWKMPMYIGTLAGIYGILSAIEYRPDPEMYGNDTWILGKCFTCRSGVCNATINVEHPGATHEVRIRLRARQSNFTFEDDGWWSNWTPKTVLIPPQRPWNPPTLGRGTFQASTGSEVGRRDIDITWRPLSVLEHNGPNLSCVVNATANGQTLSNASIFPTYVSFKDINDDSFVRVEVTTSNIMGSCNHSSVIEIFPTQNLPPLPVLPVVIYHPSTQQYELIWGTADNATQEFTVYVCTDGMDSKEPCQADLYWLSTGNMTSANVTLLDFGISGLSNREIRFALSVETAAGDISSGMSWDGCLRPQNYRATSSPPVIGNSILTNTTSATLAWTLSCENRAAVVEAVIVEWCPGSHNFSTPCESSETRITADVFSGQIILTELDSDTRYSVRLRLQYRENLSIWSEPRVFTTSKVNDPGMAGWLIFIISLGCIVSMVVLVLFSTYIRRKIKSMLQELNSPINVPTGIAQEDGIKRNSQESSRYLPALHTRKYTSEYFPSTEDIPKDTKIPNVQRSLIRKPSIGASTKQVKGGRSLEGTYLPGTSEEAENLLHQISSSETIKGSSSPGITRQLLIGSAYTQASFPLEDEITPDSADASALILHSSSLPSRGYASLQVSEQAKAPIGGYVLHNCPDITHMEVASASQNSCKDMHELSDYKPLTFNHQAGPLLNAESGCISSECVNKSFSENEPENKNTNNTLVPRATLLVSSGYVQLDNSTGDHPLHLQKQVINALSNKGSQSLPQESNLQLPEKSLGNSGYVQLDHSTGDHPIHLQQQVTNALSNSGSPSLPQESNLQLPKKSLGNSGYVQLDPSTGDHPTHLQQQVTNALSNSGSQSLPQESSLQLPKNSAYVQAEFPFENIIAMTLKSESASKPHSSTPPPKEYLALRHSQRAKNPSNGYVLQDCPDFANIGVSTSSPEIFKDMHELSANGPLFDDQNAVPNAENDYVSSQCINKLYSENENGKDSNYASVSSTMLPKDNGYVQLDQSSGGQLLQPLQTLTNRDIEGRLNKGNLQPVTSEELGSREMSSKGLEIIQNCEGSRMQKVFPKNHNGYVENPLLGNQENETISDKTIPTRERDEIASVHTKPSSGYVTAESLSDSQHLSAGKDDFNCNSWDKVDIANESSFNGGVVYTNPENTVSSKIGSTGYLIDLSANQPFIYNAEAASESKPLLPLFMLNQSRDKDDNVSLTEGADEAPVTGSPDSGFSHSNENLRRVEAFQKDTDGEVSKYNSNNEELREMQTFKTESIMSTELPSGYCRVSDIQQ